MLILIVVFSVYYLTQDGVTLNWFSVGGVLLLFWFLYELLSYGLFILFAFVSNNGHKGLDKEEKLKSGIKEL